MNYITDPELDTWRSRQEVKAAIAHEEQLAQRLRCPDCGEFGVWFVQRAINLKDNSFIEGPVAYCGGHGPSIKTDQQDPLSVLSLNWCGWLADGSTWEEGWPTY